MKNYTIINEANIMQGLYGKVSNFVNFAKKAKNENEKEVLQDDADNLKEEIKSSGVNGQFCKFLLAALIGASSLMAEPANAQESNDYITQGLEKARYFIDKVMDKVDNAVSTNLKTDPKKGVIGRGTLVDGNKFLEYADGGKLVYRADLGTNKSTYFGPNDLYKGMEWDDAIEVINTIEESYYGERLAMINEALLTEGLISDIKNILKSFRKRAEDGDESVKDDCEKLKQEVKANNKIPSMIKKGIFTVIIAIMGVMSTNAHADNFKNAMDNLDKEVAAAEMHHEDFSKLEVVRYSTDYAEKFAATIDRSGDYGAKVSNIKKTNHDGVNYIVVKFSDGMGMTIDEDSNICFFNQLGDQVASFLGSQSDDLVQKAHQLVDNK